MSISHAWRSLLSQMTTFTCLDKRSCLLQPSHRRTDLTEALSCSLLVPELTSAVIKLYLTRDDKSRVQYLHEASFVSLLSERFIEDGVSFTVYCTIMTSLNILLTSYLLCAKQARGAPSATLYVLAMDFGGRCCKSPFHWGINWFWELIWLRPYKYNLEMEMNLGSRIKRKRVNICLRDSLLIQVYPLRLWIKTLPKD